MASLKELSKKGDILSGGHRLCQGCGASIIVHQVLQVVENPVVIAVATGCLEVSSTIYPYTAWRASFIHNAFENAASTLSGVETAYRSLKKQGRLNTNFDFIAFGGDGGSYDIGLQALSGAMERGHKLLYICYDNGAYMNTGIQRSSATPYGANTTTTPAGKSIPGKMHYRKELTDIIAAHNIPYAAQTAPYYWKDLTSKVKKALEVDGPSFINVLSVCPRGWRTAEERGMELSKLAVETRFWPMYEVEKGEYHLTHQPRKQRPVVDWLKPQGRFKHLFTEENKGMIDDIQEYVDRRWEKLLFLSKELEGSEKH